MSKHQPVKLVVVRTERLTPDMQRVVLGGDDFELFLERYEALPALPGGLPTDCYVKLVFLDPSVDYPEPLDLMALRDVVPQESWPVLRTYTIRWIDRSAEELAIDFVVHGDTGFAGPWARDAEPGDVMHLRGPSGAYAPDPAADWHLYVGDEAAIPAIGAALERLDAGTKAVAFIEVDGPEDEHRFNTVADLDLYWLHRGAEEAGSTELLATAVRSLEWPSGRAQVFIHGEAQLLKSVRPYVLKDRGVPRTDVSVSGYWRRGNTEESFRVWKSEHKD